MQKQEVRVMEMFPQNSSIIRSLSGSENIAKTQKIKITQKRKKAFEVFYIDLLSVMMRRHAEFCLWDEKKVLESDNPTNAEILYIEEKKTLAEAALSEKISNPKIEMDEYIRLMFKKRPHLKEYFIEEVAEKYRSLKSFKDLDKGEIRLFFKVLIIFSGYDKKTFQKARFTQKRLGKDRVILFRNRARVKKKNSKLKRMRTRKLQDYMFLLNIGIKGASFPGRRIPKIEKAPPLINLPDYPEKFHIKTGAVKMNNGGIINVRTRFFHRNIRY